jgi:hypothetical protein
LTFFFDHLPQAALFYILLQEAISTFCKGATGSILYQVADYFDKQNGVCARMSGRWRTSQINFDQNRFVFIKSGL